MMIDFCYQMVGTMGQNKGPKRLWHTMTLCDLHARASMRILIEAF